MQQAQAEHLRQLIETSPILSPSEKADWLDMLILMNDKQASELEEILKNQHAPAAPAPAPAVPANVRPAAIPPLTHISNLPSGLTQSAQPTGPAPVMPQLTPVQTPPLPMPWQKQFEATMAEKELPASSMKAPVASSPARAGISRPLPSLTSARPTPPATDSAPRLSYPVPKRRSAPAPVHLETLADTAKLSVAAIRNMDATDLLIRLQQLSKMEGYFNLLSFLEDSPLYRSYLNTGQKILSGQLSFDTADRNDTSILTKEEFEAFTDILRKIQIN